MTKEKIKAAVYTRRYIYNFHYWSAGAVESQAIIS